MPIPNSYQPPKPADPPRPWSRSRVGLYLAAIAVAATAVAAWMVIRQLNELEGRVAELDQQVSTAEERAEQATARAATAEQQARESSQRAGEAEELAALADAERSSADEARRSAETEAEFARQDADRAADAARAAQTETERVRAEREREIGRLQDALGNIADTQRTALGLVMNLGEDAINFDTDKATLKPADRELLSRVVGVLLTTSGYRIQVFGHTDDVGTAEYNQRLSERRAQAVTDYLAGAGIDPEIITTKGFGKTKPLTEGTSEAARARNRRVELGIIDSSVEYTTEPTPRRRQD